MQNRDAAKAVFALASLLESLGANPYRVRAYRRAALRFMQLPRPAAEYTNERGELDLPSLGPRLRRKLGELVVQGKMQFADDLVDGLPPPWRELLGVPGVGPRTAAKLIQELHIQSVSGLAAAADGGRLRTLRGIGIVRERQLGAAAAALLTTRAA